MNDTRFDELRKRISEARVGTDATDAFADMCLELMQELADLKEKQDALILPDSAWFFELAERHGTPLVCPNENCRASNGELKRIRDHKIPAWTCEKCGEHTFRPRYRSVSIGEHLRALGAMMLDDEEHERQLEIAKKELEKEARDNVAIPT